MQEGFSIALPKKALLDTFYFRKGLPVEDGVDTGLLRKLSEFYPKRVREWAANQH